MLDIKKKGYSSRLNNSLSELITELQILGIENNKTLLLEEFKSILEINESESN